MSSQYSITVLKNLSLLGGILSGYSISRKYIDKILNKSPRYSKLPQDSKDKILSYFISLINAVFTTSYGVKKLLDSKPSESNRGLMLSIVGYLIYDLISSFKLILERPSDLLHHVLGVGIGIASLKKIVNQYVHYLIIVEGSTIALDISLILKELDFEDTLAYNISGYSFAILFFCLRVVWMPLFSLYILKQNPQMYANFGPMKYAYIIVCFLQFYWFNLILKRFKEVKQENTLKSKL